MMIFATPRIALVGKSGAGKSQAAESFSLRCGTIRISTGAICRKISVLLFGNESKASTQKIDDALTSLDPSIFLNAALRDAPRDQPICVDALRFTSDLALAQRYEFTIVRVVAPTELRTARLAQRGQVFDSVADAQHRSENELDDVPVDYTIINDGDLASLDASVRDICARLR